MSLFGVQWQPRAVSESPVFPSEVVGLGRLSDLDNGIRERHVVDVSWSEVLVSSSPRRLVHIGDLFP